MQMLLEARVDRIEFHIEGLKQEGYEVPGSHSHAAYCEVTV